MLYINNSFSEAAAVSFVKDICEISNEGFVYPLWKVPKINGFYLSHNSVFQIFFKSSSDQYDGG